MDKAKLSGSDYRLFQNTKAWQLAKLIQDNNFTDIGKMLTKDSSILNYQEATRGNTLLMLCISNRQIEMSKLLLDFGANPNLYDKNGSSAIIMACRDKELNPRLIQWLLNSGSNVNDMELGDRRKGNTTRDFPLITASRSGNLPLVSFLVSQGADVNKTNEFGHTALREATLQHHYDIILFLLRSGSKKDVEIFKRPDEYNKSYKLKDVLLEDKLQNPIKQEIMRLLDE